MTSFSLSFMYRLLTAVLQARYRESFQSAEKEASGEGSGCDRFCRNSKTKARQGKVLRKCCFIIRMEVVLFHTEEERNLLFNVKKYKAIMMELTLRKDDSFIPPFVNPR